MIGRRVWAVPGGMIPLRSHGREPEQTSRDELCVLNASEKDTEVRLMVYYEDHDPVGPHCFHVAARRVRHVRCNDLIDPEAIPLETPYALVVVSDEPVVVMFTRKDTGQAENAWMGTMAYPAE